MRPAASRSTSLAAFGPPDLDFYERIAKHMLNAKCFPDVKSVSLAVVKMMAGRSVGFDPFVSMDSIHIINGKATFSARALAALVKGSPKYDYRIPALDDQACTVVIYRTHGPRLSDWEEIGGYTFTMAKALAAGLPQKNPTWKKFPENMLFARALSNAVRFHCNDVSVGNFPLYTTEEMLEQSQDIDLDRVSFTEDGEIVLPGGAEERPAPPPAPPVIRAVRTSAREPAAAAKFGGPGGSAALGQGFGGRVEVLDELGVSPEEFEELFGESFSTCDDGDWDAYVRTLEKRREVAAS